MNSGVGSALKDHRSCASQRLQFRGIGIALPVIPNFRQQPRSQPLAGTRQALKDRVVGMTQKKLGNFLVVGRDLLDQRQQLGDQGQSQARFGARGDLGGLQLRLLHHCNDLAGHLFGSGMLRLLEELSDLLRRGRSGLLQSRIGLQKEQGRALLQFGKQGRGGCFLRLVQLFTRVSVPLLSPSVERACN